MIVRAAERGSREAERGSREGQRRGREGQQRGTEGQQRGALRERGIFMQSGAVREIVRRVEGLNTFTLYEPVAVL